MFVWRLGNELVFRGAWQISDPFITAIFPRRPAVPCHYIRIDINRINWIRHCDLVSIAQDVEDVTAIAFRSVGNKDFVIGNIDLAVAVIALRNCRSEKFVTLLWPVTAKRFRLPELVDRPL